MFFIISKLFSALIDPTVWLIIIVVVAAFFRAGKWKKRVSILALVLFLFFTNRVLLNKIINAWQPAPVLLNRSYDAGVVLGGFSSFDKDGNGYLNNTSDRFITTANLYHLGFIRNIIVSGGDGTIDQDKPKESVFAAKKFIDNGVDANHVFSEERSRNTSENAYYSKKILDSLHLRPPYVLITSALHMRRAQAAFDKAGLNVVIYPCAYETLHLKFHFYEYFVPSIDTLFQWRKFLKEVVGMWMYRITGRG